MKYLLDTCVISEMMKPQPNPSVVEWFSEIPDEEVYLSAVTIGELCEGFQKLPPSYRRTAFERWFRIYVEDAFASRILPYDKEAAKRWADIMARTSAEGHPRPAIDTMIVAIADLHGMIVVTRNERDMRYTGVPLLNPFAETEKGES